MTQQKLKFRFHNPNTAEVTVDYIAKLFVEVNQKKIQQTLHAAAAAAYRLAPPAKE